MTNEQQPQVDPARAGVDVEHDAPTPDTLGQNERSAATELDESMPITDAAADQGA